MSGIQEAFRGHVPYQFTTLKVVPTEETLVYNPRRTATTQHEYLTCLSSSYLLIWSLFPQDLRDPLEEITDLQEQQEKKQKALQSNTDR